MKQIPHIEEYMTPMPYTISPDMPLLAAAEIMKERGVRHLPVQLAGKLMGILTERDLGIGRSLDYSGEYRVDDVMTPDPYTVTPDALLRDVVLTMAEHKYGCAVVQYQNGNVVGIFTAIDGLRILAEKI